MDDLIIDVTQEDIDKGERFSGEECPIAQAIYRTCHPWGATVDNDEMIIYHDDGPPEVYYARGQKMFVKAFDKGKPVKPRRFVFKAIL